MDDFITYFDKLAFPVAVCAVLFYALYHVIKAGIRQSDATVKMVQDAQQQHLADLKSQNEKLSAIIADCTKALAENTIAYKKLIFLLEQKKVPD